LTEHERQLGDLFGDQVPADYERCSEGDLHMLKNNRVFKDFPNFVLWETAA
jgi:hypothetical protein